MFRHACAMGLEGIVSKRVESLQVGACLAWSRSRTRSERRSGLPLPRRDYTLGLLRCLAACA